MAPASSTGAFQLLGRPDDGIGNHAGYTFGNTIGRDNIEAFGVTGLQQKVHMTYGLAELRPRLPAGFRRASR